MSLRDSELPRSVVQKWRNWALDPAFDAGLDHLRRIHCPSIGGATDAEMLKNAAGWTQYQKALDDIENLLTSLPKTEKSAESPGLITPDGPEDEP